MNNCWISYTERSFLPTKDAPFSGHLFIYALVRKGVRKGIVKGMCLINGLISARTGRNNCEGPGNQEDTA